MNKNITKKLRFNANTPLPVAPDSDELRSSAFSQRSTPLKW